MNSKMRSRWERRFVVAKMPSLVQWLLQRVVKVMRRCDSERTIRFDHPSGPDALCLSHAPHRKHHGTVGRFRHQRFDFFTLQPGRYPGEPLKQPAAPVVRQKRPVFGECAKALAGTAEPAVSARCRWTKYVVIS
jgi:hypothetical protein